MKNATPVANATPGTRARRSNALFLAADAALVLGLAGGAWWWHSNRLPNVEIPAVAIPAPNGYDRLGAAGLKIVRREDVDAALSRDEAQTQRIGHAMTSAERAALVAENAGALAAARDALELPLQVPPVRSIDQTFPEFAQMRAMARLMRVEGQTFEDRGENARAADAYLDSMQMGNALMPRSFLISRLVGIACEAIGRRPLLPLADRLTADEARGVARRLESLSRNRPPIAETFEQEKWGMQNSLLHEFGRHSLYSFLVESRRWTTPDSSETEPGFSERTRDFAAALRLTKAGVMKTNREYMDRVIASARLPYRTAAAQTIEEPTDAINRIMLPVFSQAVHKEADTRAQNALLLGKLALRAYQLEHGDLPESLAELVTGGYLKAAPTDPFTDDGAPLSYHRVSATKYLLYSVGPDGVDDGASPIDNRHGGDKQRPWTEPASTGDFVLGVNYF